MKERKTRGLASQKQMIVASCMMLILVTCLTGLFIARKMERKRLDADIAKNSEKLSEDVETEPIQAVDSVILPEVKKEENNVDTAGRWALSVVVVNRGNVDAVMDAARSRGARGGTVLHARRVGMEDMEKVLGFPVQPEKEIVAILAPQEHKRPLMEAISEAAGITTEARGVLFALPVEDLIGLQALAAE